MRFRRLTLIKFNNLITLDLNNSILLLFTKPGISIVFI
jgi:hypothetical protein